LNQTKNQLPITIVDEDKTKTIAKNCENLNNLFERLS